MEAEFARLAEKEILSPKQAAAYLDHLHRLGVGQRPERLLRPEEIE